MTGVWAKSVEDDLGDVSGALATGFSADVADRGKGASDQRHDLIGSGVTANEAGLMRAIE